MTRSTSKSFDSKPVAQSMVTMVVAIDANSDECLYIDGQCWPGKGETTIYVADLITHAHGRLINLTHLSIDAMVDEEWPDQLDTLMERYADERPLIVFLLQADRGELDRKVGNDASVD